MNKKIEKFNSVRDEFISLADRFPEEKRLDILFSDWSLKDVVSHLSNWMVHDIDCLTALKEGREPYWEPEIEEFNKKGIEARKGKNWEEIYKEFIDLGNELSSLYKTLPDNLWGKPIWKGRNETAMKFLEEDIDHLQNEHLPELKEKLVNYESKRA